MHEPCETKLDLSGQALGALTMWALGGRGLGSRGEQLGMRLRLALATTASHCLYAGSV